MMRGLRACLLLGACLLGAACQSGGAAQNVPASAADGRELTPALEAFLARDIQRATQAGAGPAQLVASGSGIPGDNVGGFVEVAEDRCVLVFARGSRGVEDLDVFVYADDGTILASDEASEKDASALFCPPHPKRAYVAGRVATGYGLIAVTAQEVDPENAAALAALFDAQGKPEQPREIDSSWQGLDDQLAVHRRQIGGEWQSLRRVALPVDPRVSVRVSASVEANRCLDIFITPSDDVAYLELEVLDDDGRWIGSGAGRGRERTMIVCSPEKRQLTIQSRPHAGRGLAALVLSRSSDGGARQLVPDVARYDLRPPGTLPEVRDAHARQLLAEGYGAGVLVHKGQLAVDRRLSLPISLRAGCSRVDVLTASPIRTVRAWLWNAQGQLLAEDSQGAAATLFTCSDAGRARLDLETDARTGEFAVELRASATSPEAALQNPLAASRLLNLMQVRRSFRSLDDLPKLSALPVSSARLARLDFRVPAGRCLELVAALGPDTTGLEIRLFRSQPSEQSFDDGDLGYGLDAASARVCAQNPDQEWPVSAELRANVGRGVALWSSRIFSPDQAGRENAASSAAR
jgi:hypothetical protein